MTSIDRSTNVYKKKQDSDLVSVYQGYDEFNRSSIVIKLRDKPTTIIQSKSLQTEIALRNDGLWALTISLNDYKLKGVFDVLADDMLIYIQNEKNQKLAERKIVLRYNDWQALFNDFGNEYLPFRAIQGLLGELIFLKKNLIPKYGEEKSINAWVGPIGGDKDFIFEDIWFEVKSKCLNKETIHISSNTQLKSSMLGKLVVLECEKSSIESKFSVTLNTLVDEISDSLLSATQKSLFHRRLLKFGYRKDDYYNDFYFFFSGGKLYKVREGFPNIELNEYEGAILNVTYELYLPKVSKYIVKEFNYD